MDKLRISATSDLHGYFPKIQPCDLLFICGDISPTNIQFNKPKMKAWLEEEFSQWLNTIDVEVIYLIAGNHDGYFEGLSAPSLEALLNKISPKLKYLKNETATYLSNSGISYTIFGTPYCHIFGNWPFMRDEHYLEKKFAQIPDQVDFILTHDTPYGVGLQDVILNTYRHKGFYQHVGNIPLKLRLEQISYKWLFHGHIHSSDHEATEFGTGSVVNVSYVNELYAPEYEPFYLEIDETAST